MGIKTGNTQTNSKRGCLCKDKNMYSVDCCNGETINQGIGSLTGQSSGTVIRE